MESSGIFERLIMADDERRQRSLTLLSTCEEMILLAGKGEWERVAELEARRVQELTDYFTMPVLDEDSPAVATVIKALISMNDRLVKLVVEAKTNTGLQAEEIRYGLQAVEQYRTV